MTSMVIAMGKVKLNQL